MHSVNREYAWMTAAVRIAEVRKSCANHVNNATGFEADIQTLRGIREPSVWCETVQGVCCSPQSFCREAGETCFNIKSFPRISCKRKPALRALSGFAAHIQCAAKQPEWYRVGRLSCVSLVFGSAVNAAFERGFFYELNSKQHQEGE